MLYSFKIEQAIRAATVLHNGQVRKGRAPYPCVSHLYSVACIVADYTEDENTIISALLHDVLEETEYRREELEADFGKDVRTIVEGITEYQDLGDERPWLLKRRRYLEQLAGAPDESLLVAAADTIHNIRSIIEEYEDNIVDYLTDFGGTLEDRLIYYQKFSNILNTRLKNPIINEFNHVFQEYKAFVDQGAR